MGLEDGLYLEAISIDPAAPPPACPRWFDLDSFTGAPRLTNWICQTEDITGLPDDLGVPVSLARGDLRWDMAVPATGRLPFDNMHPALITWHGDLHPARMLEQVGARLIHLTVQHPEGGALQTRVGNIPNADVRFEAGAPALYAVFDTPHGRRALT